MIVSANPVDEKIDQVVNELKALHLWKDKMPDWVTGYSGNLVSRADDFASWLQFIFLPNMQYRKTKKEQRELIAPLAVKYFGEDIKRGKLLQLLIELDSL